MGTDHAYKTVIVESYKPDSTSGLHGNIHIRPVTGQGYPKNIHVRCSKELSKNYPVGTNFRIQAKLTDRDGGGKFMHSPYSWDYDVISIPTEALGEGVTEAERIAGYFEALWTQDWLVFPERSGDIYATERKGVYIIASPREVVLHVGSTPRGKRGIYQRLRNHLSGKSSFATCYLKPRNIDLKKNYFYCYLPIKSPRVRGLVEAYAIAKLCPKNFGTHA